jgi:hypothetical protein
MGKAANHKSSVPAVLAGWQAFRKCVRTVAFLAEPHVRSKSNLGDGVALTPQSHADLSPYLNNIQPYPISHWRQLSKLGTTWTRISESSYTWSQMANTFASISVAKGRSQLLDRTSSTASLSTTAFDASIPFYFEYYQLQFCSQFPLLGASRCSKGETGEAA